mmetsp:Transcript_119647/g.284212  ORF Transcript_119647/g.284212 Transcript_119647/m.284212 type:complete len:205 (-) Transcript_119647:1119-1733(-)
MGLTHISMSYASAGPEVDGSRKNAVSTGPYCAKGPDLVCAYCHTALGLGGLMPKLSLAPRADRCCTRYFKETKVWSERSSPRLCDLSPLESKSRGVFKAPAERTRRPLGRRRRTLERPSDLTRTPLATPASCRTSRTCVSRCSSKFSRPRASGKSCEAVDWRSPSFAVTAGMQSEPAFLVRSLECTKPAFSRALRAKPAPVLSR